MDFRQMIDLAEGEGLLIASRSIGRHHGRYLHRKNLILLSNRITGPQTISVLAHELGHWHYGDSDPEGIHARDVEARAWRWAARLLVTPHRYAAAEHAVGPHLGAIARELGVTRQLLEHWSPHAAPHTTWRTA